MRSVHRWLILLAVIVVASSAFAQTTATLNGSVTSEGKPLPGVTDTGPNNQIVIHGAQSFDNLYLVNGVVVNENVRGQPQAAVIEDAIQETTLLTGGVSAEFGRFTGGVVSTITKSGGNDFSGSLRDNLTNPSWTKKSDFAAQVANLDELNHQYEGTLGGRMIRDRLWFFTAGRYQKTNL